MRRELWILRLLTMVACVFNLTMATSLQDQVLWIVFAVLMLRLWFSDARR